MSQLDVVVTGYNVRDFIKPCLESIFSCGDKVDFKCYYVDDGSEDGTSDLVKSSFPQVEVIRHERNKGWGAACNSGIKKGDSDFILLINSDVIVNSNTLDAPVEYFKKNPEVGAIGGKIFFPDGRLQKECMCRAFPTLLSEFIGLTLLDRVFKTNRFFGRYKMLYLNYDKEIEVDQPSGTYLAIRRRAIEDVGLFDERYKFYYDDVDLSFRFKKKGWKQMFIPDGSVVHYGTHHGGKTISQMGPEVIARRIRNKQFFFRKNYGNLQYYLLKSIITIEVIEKFLFSLFASIFIKGKDKGMAKRHLSGFWKAFRYCFNSVSEEVMSAQAKKCRKRIIMIAPFGLKPFGTVKARMFPIATALRGYEVSVVIPPIFDIDQSGKEYTRGNAGIYNIKVFRRFSLWHVPILTLRMIRKTLSLKGDIIHVFKPKGMSGFVAMFFILFTRRVVILDTDDLEGKGGWNDLLNYAHWVKRMIEFQERWLVRHAKAVTVPNKTLGEKIMELGAKSENIYYLPNALESNRLYIKPDGSLVKKKYGFGNIPIILLYTRFIESDLRKIIDIARQIRVKCDTKIFVIGKGPNSEEGKLLELAKKAELEDMFIFYVGWLPDKELADYIDATDVAIYPFDDIQINRFKAPSKILEIMSVGKPLVVDAMGQIKEYVVHGESGFLANPWDTQKFSNYVISLLNNKDLREKMGKKAKKRIQEHFIWDKNIEIVETIYAKYANFRQTAIPNIHAKPC